uniref:Uncharacterized protein n=1 Tax=Podoviridae sp. ctiwu7 TaxID=2825269 RepID=A0A8S5QCS3_9CAUD|nr:MAG TPA: hypothetical protein [Podoviridae sp. ctiwu7]
MSGKNWPPKRGALLVRHDVAERRSKSCLRLRFPCLR